jgi:histone deacetylase 8
MVVGKFGRLTPQTWNSLTFLHPLSPYCSHHAQKANAAGFCYVADIVLALLKIKKAPGKPRILYIDLDVHFSDGVSEPFANSFKSSKNAPQILTLSIHHTALGFYPSSALSTLTKSDTSDPYTLSIPLQAGASSVTFYKIWESVERLKAAFDPVYVIVQCGVDGLAGDPTAKWNWTVDREEPGSMGWCIQSILNWKCKTLLLGGGWSSPLRTGHVLNTNRRIPFS